MKNSNLRNSNFIAKIPEMINDVIVQMLEDNIEGIPFPAKIISYDKNTKRAIIKPLIEILDGDGELLFPPQIPNTIVINYSTKLANIPLKLDVGYEGIAIITSVGLENWSADGGDQEENEFTKGAMQNCFFFPAACRQVDGQINLLKNISDTLAKVVDSLSQTATALGKVASATTTVPALGVPTPLDGGTTSSLTLAKSAIEANVSSINELKGLFDSVYDI